MRTITHTKQTVVNICLAVLMAAGAWQVAHADRDDDEDSRNGLRVIGLTDSGRLVSFRARSPERTRDLGFVTGLTGADTALVGIDFRVQDGKLYGVGNGGGVYTIDPKAAAAAASGFDIYSLLRNGVTVANYAFATLSVDGRYRFYAVNVTTGQAFSLGRFDEAVVDIAVPLNQ